MDMLGLGTRSLKCALTLALLLVGPRKAVVEQVGLRLTWKETFQQ